MAPYADYPSVHLDRIIRHGIPNYNLSLLCYVIRCGIERMRFGEWLLITLSRDPCSPDYAGGTLLYDEYNALDFLIKTVPTFKQKIRGKRVLDYGCGWGWQTALMVREGAREVVGLEIEPKGRERARRKAAEYGFSGRITIKERLDEAEYGTFDLVISSSSFEHFADPEAELRAMRRAVAEHGSVIISFAEPWYSHSGSHMNFFCRVPWMNLWWSEETLMRVRGRYRHDGARRFEEVGGGLNRMTLAKFTRIIRNSGMDVRWMKAYPTKGLPLVAHIPVLRELLVSAVAVELTINRGNELSCHGAAAPHLLKYQRHS
jgi:SAM-dependent methyltransferase